MSRSLFILKLIIPLIIFFLQGCGSQPGEGNQEEHEQEEHQTEESLSVELTERQVAAVDIQTGNFFRLPLKNTVKANGTLKLPPQSEAEVSALISGAVSTINVVEGDFVEEGQELAVLEDPQVIEVQQDYIAANEQLSYLQQNYERKKRLADEEVGSQREFQQIASEYRSTRARTAGLEAKLELLGLNPDQILEGDVRSSVPVQAPFQGHIQRIEAHTGSYVSPGQPLFQIIDNSQLFFELMVFEKDLHKVQDEQMVFFTSTSHSNPQPYRGRVYATGKAFEQDPKAIRVQAEITGEHKNLLPGMYVEARIVTDSTEVLALPEDAVVTDGGTSYIFVQDKQGHSSNAESANPPADAEHGQRFSAVEVLTGTSDNGFLEIKLLEGLPDGQEVVTKGAFFILSEMKKGEGGHHH